MRKKLVWLLSAVMVVSAVMLGGCGGKKVTAESKHGKMQILYRGYEHGHDNGDV